MLLLCAALGLQCSDDDGGETDVISRNPRPEKNSADKATFFNDPSIVFGYTDVTNARLLVTRVDSVAVDPEYAYISDWWNQNPGGGIRENTAVTEVYFDFLSNAVKVTFPEDARYALLCASDNSGTLWLPQWDLQYDWDEGGRLTLGGKGRGSHLPEAINLYYEQFEAFLASEVLFEFRGEWDGKTDSYMGTFSVIEKSPEAAFNLEIYGAMTVLIDAVF